MGPTVQNHSQFYSKSYFYDVAFRFKDIQRENNFLVSVNQKFNQRKPVSFVDIAAGPASNAIELSKVHGIKVFAVDYSVEMRDYGSRSANSKNIPLVYVHADMRNFELPEKVDLAAIFMSSTTYLLTNEDMIQHLRSVARNLNPGGLYVLEMNHPRDVFSVGSSTVSNWEMQDGDCKVTVNWGSPNDVFNPITQVTRTTAQLKFETPTESGDIVESSDQREYTYQEMRLLVEASRVFEWAGTFGTWDLSVPFTNDKSAWRMIPVLRKLTPVTKE